MKKNRMRLCAWLFMLWGISAPALAIDLQDPHHDNFLRLALASASAVVNGDSGEMLEARFSLLGDTDTCKTAARDNLRKQLDLMQRREKDNKALHKDVQTLLRAGLRFAEQRWALGEEELQKLSDGAIKQERFTNLMYDLARYFEEGKRYRAIAHLGDGMVTRYSLLALPAKFSSEEMGRAYFIMGDLEKFLDYGKRRGQPMIDEWAITAELRLGREKEAMARQRKLDKARELNYTGIAMAKGPAARAKACAQIMKDQYTNGKDKIQRTEAGARDRVNTNWGPLLCGQFHDVMRLEDKSRWSSLRGTCPGNHWVYNITDHFNSVVACTYESNRLRTAKKKDANGTFERCLEHARGALFIDSFSGYSQVHVVLDDDFGFYLKRTFGLNAEAYVVMGVMQEARKDYAGAVEAYSNALAESSPLLGKWPNRIEKWRDRAARRADIARKKALQKSLTK